MTKSIKLLVLLSLFSLHLSYPSFAMEEDDEIFYSKKNPRPPQWKIDAKKGDSLFGSDGDWNPYVWSKDNPRPTPPPQPKDKPIPFSEFKEEISKLTIVNGEPVFNQQSSSYNPYQRSYGYGQNSGGYPSSSGSWTSLSNPGRPWQ